MRNGIESECHTIRVGCTFIAFRIPDPQDNFAGMNVPYEQTVFETRFHHTRSPAPHPGQKFFNLSRNYHGVFTGNTRYAVLTHATRGPTYFLERRLDELQNYTRKQVLWQTAASRPRDPQCPLHELGSEFACGECHASEFEDHFLNFTSGEFVVFITGCSLNPTSDVILW